MEPFRNQANRLDWNPNLRWVLLTLLAFGLIIPLQLVNSVVHERHDTYRGVLSEIAGLWSGEQILTGPALVLPFTERFQEEETYVTPYGERKTQLVWRTLDRELACDSCNTCSSAWLSPSFS